MVTLPRELISRVAQFCDSFTLSTLLDDATLAPWLKPNFSCKIEDEVPRGYPVYELGLMHQTKNEIEWYQLSQLFNKSARCILIIHGVESYDLREFLYSTQVTRFIRDGPLLSIRFPAVEELEPHDIDLFLFNIHATPAQFLQVELPELKHMITRLGSQRNDYTNMGLHFRIKAPKLTSCFITVSLSFKTDNKLDQILQKLCAPQLTVLSLMPENDSIRVGTPLLVDLWGVLAQFASLKSFVLQGRTFEVVSINSGIQHQLQELHLESCSIRYLLSTGLFSCLKRVLLIKVENLVCLKFLSDSHELQELTIHDCNELREIASMTFPKLEKLSLRLTRPDGPLMFRNLSFPQAHCFEITAKALKIEVVNISAPRLGLDSEDFIVTKDSQTNIETWVSFKRELVEPLLEPLVKPEAPPRVTGACS